jgi:hypothetical protein
MTGGPGSAGTALLSFEALKEGVTLTSASVVAFFEIFPRWVRRRALE